MNTLELEAYKAELAREVLSIDNKEVLDDIKEIILKGTGHHAPYRMNFSEVKQHLQASESGLMQENTSVRNKWKSFLTHCGNDYTIRR